MPDDNGTLPEDNGVLPENNEILSNYVQLRILYLAIIQLFFLASFIFISFGLNHLLYSFLKALANKDYELMDGKYQIKSNLQFFK